MQPDPTSPFASVINLGAFKSGHSPSKRSRWINVIFSGLFLAAGPVLLLVALYLAYAAYVVLSATRHALLPRLIRPLHVALARQRRQVQHHDLRRTAAVLKLHLRRRVRATAGSRRDPGRRCSPGW